MRWSSMGRNASASRTMGMVMGGETLSVTLSSNVEVANMLQDDLRSNWPSLEERIFPSGNLSW